MKKYLFLAVAATALFASCSNDEVVEMNPQNAIGFSTFVDKSTRAATDPSYTVTNGVPTGWTNFSVWGYDNNGAILANETVTYGNGWTYANIAYWAENMNYSFYAIAPASEGEKASVTKDSGISEITDFTQTATDQIDLLYAAPVTRSITTLDAQPAAVEFTFKHILSKVKFTFTNEMPNENIKVVVKDIKITNAALKGTATNSASGWTWNTATESNNLELSFGTTDALVQGAQGECTNEMLLIPANREYNITFTVELYSGDATTASASYNHNVTLNTEFKTGYSYNLVAAINADNAGGDEDLYPIEFSVNSIDAWTTAENVTISNDYASDAE